MNSQTLTKLEGLNTAILTEATINQIIDLAGEVDTFGKNCSDAVKCAKELMVDFWLDHREEAGKKLAGTVYEAGFSESDVFNEIDVNSLYALLQERGQLGDFFHVIKVDLPALKKVLSGNDLARLRGEATGKKISVRLTEKK